jgi:tetraacyldisaccharide 4'-kinase
MEGDLIKIHKWLYPISFLYGMGVNLRNQLFDWKILRARSFDVPVICIGNITVGGTGKTPHTEYLIRLLQKEFQVAVLSRGYKRKSKGFVLATPETPITQIGDEPYQMKQKFPDVHVAVDADRCNGIEQLCDSRITPEVEVILLDDAFQHRYVKPGINILLVDYHRMIGEDALLPAGRLREPERGKSRANIVIVTKCPHNIKPMDYRIISKQIDLYPYQKLYFSTLTYGELIPLHKEESTSTRPLNSLAKDEKVLLLTGIASPQQLKQDLEDYTSHIESLSFPDHHAFTANDLQAIKQKFEQMGAGKKLIITTEKDATRLIGHPHLDDTLKKAIYVLPIEITILQNQQETFNENIIKYVRANSRNSILHKSQNVHHS